MSYPESCSIETIERALTHFEKMKMISMVKDATTGDKILMVDIQEEELKNIGEQLSNFLKDQEIIKKQRQMMMPNLSNPQFDFTTLPKL